MKAAFLAALSLAIAGFAAAQNSDADLLRSVSPSALPAAPAAIVGVPAAAQPLDFSLFRKNIAAAQSELSERDLKKAAITSPRDGVYDVNLKLAALQDGKVILSYFRYLNSSNDQRYARLLQDTKIYELKDSAGAKHFYQYNEHAKSNREISAFDAAGQLVTEDFLQSAFSPALTADERDALKRRLKERDILPLSTAPSQGVGLWLLKVFNGNSKAIHEIPIPTLAPSCPSTSLDYCHFSQALK